MNDEVPEELIQEMETTNTLYTYNEWDKNVNELINNITTQRIDELNNVLESVKNNKK
jgi:hypothetical protein